MMLTYSEICDIIANIELEGVIEFQPSDWGDGHYFLRVIMDSDEGPQACRFWFLKPDINESEIVQTALMATLAAMEHEIREHFTYQGEPIFQPHLDVAELVIREKARKVLGL